MLEITLCTFIVTNFVDMPHHDDFLCSTAAVALLLTAHPPHHQSTHLIPQICNYPLTDIVCQSFLKLPT